MNSKTRCAYLLPSRAASGSETRPEKERGTSGLEPAEDKEMCRGGNHSKTGVNIGPTVEGDMCWLLDDVEHAAILCLEEFCCCFQIKYPV
jgi:hypothetical protein